MENMNIENVVEEVVENMEETMPIPVQKNGVSMGGAVVAALITYCAIEGIKWAGCKAAKLFKKRKVKKNQTAKEEDVFETPIPEIDEEENK